MRNLLKNYLKILKLFNLIIHHFLSGNTRHVKLQLRKEKEFSKGYVGKAYTREGFPEPKDAPVTDGKIIDANGTRNPKRFADYVLYHGGMIIAIVEAKDEGKDHLVGIPQAKDYW